MWRHVGMMLHLRSRHPGNFPRELPGQWHPSTVQHLQETGERLRKYKRKYNKLRGVVPECPTISSSDSEECLHAKKRRKQSKRMKRARQQAQQAAEKKQWEEQQQDLLRQIAQLQAQAAQPSEPPVQPPAPVAPPQAGPPKMGDQPEVQARPPEIVNQPEAQAEPPQIAHQPGAQAEEQGPALQPPTEKSQASGHLWKDPRECYGDAVQCRENKKVRRSHAR